MAMVAHSLSDRPQQAFFLSARSGLWLLFATVFLVQTRLLWVSLFCIVSDDDTKTGEQSQDLVQKEEFTPPYVTFDIEQDHNNATDDFMRGCKRDRKHARFDSILDRFEWQTNPACRKIAEHPKVINAARKVMGLDSDAPLWLYTTRSLTKDNGSVHRLHTDLESDTPECRPLGSALVWIMTERKCPTDKPPITILAGSHLLSNNAHQELIKRECWSHPREELPCNVSDIFEDLKNEKPFLEVVDGPQKPLHAIAWPSTTWHMARDTCRRSAIVVHYAASLACARSIHHRFAEKEFGTFKSFPDRAPYALVGARSLSNQEVFLDGAAREWSDPMEKLYTGIFPKASKLPWTCAELKDSAYEDYRSKAVNVSDAIHVSGEYTVSKKFGHWELKFPAHPVVHNNRFAVWSHRIGFDPKDREMLVHDPHVEDYVEMCVVLKGRVNFAIGGSCHEPFDVLSLGPGKVIVKLPGIYHTTSPDAEEEGEQICFKVFPLRAGATRKGRNLRKTLQDSRDATKALDEDFLSNKSGKLEIFHKEGKKLGLPGYDKLNIFLFRLVKGQNDVKRHTDEHDLIILAVTGDLYVLTSDDTSFSLPEHQFIFIRAGMEHGFESQHGEAVALAIELR